MISQKTILVVEDNAVNRMTLCAILASRYRVLEAENGQDALKVLKEHNNDISLILLDIVMPVMDGYAFLSAIREDPLFSSIPVIVTTQSDGEAELYNVFKPLYYLPKTIIISRICAICAYTISQYCSVILYHFDFNV